jgi:hypothetical protein
MVLAGMKQDVALECVGKEAKALVIRARMSPLPIFPSLFSLHYLHNPTPLPS